ncbi:hypothetical protein K4K54_001015 [Colletotrichum sp. SAR 10_86]|nr:hypothetical protein K4K52_004084 [Colletotrichum sp. SAR 10_76]KAI8237074.1 hypothetical protein K4K54_001015 [Colletotrichum sp. SAR 10_86]
MASHAEERATQPTAPPAANPAMTAQEPGPSKNPAAPTESSASETESSSQDSRNQISAQEQQQGVRRREGRQRQVYEYQQGEDGSTAQQVAPQNGQQVQSKGKGAPSVRLDMDLDVDIELKAKIQGDLTLSILGGNQEKKK